MSSSQHPFSPLAQPDIAHDIFSKVSHELSIKISALQRTFHPKINLKIFKPPSLSSLKGDHTGCYGLITLKFPDVVYFDKDEIEGIWGKEARQINLKDQNTDDEKFEKGEEMEEVRFGVKAWRLSPPLVDIERPERMNKDEDVEVELGHDGRINILSIAMMLDMDERNLEIPFHARYLRPSNTGNTIDQESTLSWERVMSAVGSCRRRVWGILKRDNERYREVILINGFEGKYQGITATTNCAMSNNKNHIFGKPPKQFNGNPSQQENSAQQKHVDPNDLSPSSLIKKDDDSPKQPYSIVQRGNQTCLEFRIEPPSKSKISLPDIILLDDIQQEALTLQLPIGHLDDLVMVESVTALVIWVGWIYLMWKMFRLVNRLSKKKVKTA